MVITEAIDKANEALALGWDGNFPVDPSSIASAITMVRHSDGARLPIIVEGEPLDAQSGYAEYVSGTTNVDEHFRCVFNSYEPTTRQRFTQAHELGHVMLGHVYEGSSPRRDSSFNDSGDPQEWAANAFAANILMPETYVRHQASRVTDIAELANFFGVSPWALKIRLESLGII